MKSVLILAILVFGSGCQSRPPMPTAPATTIFEGLKVDLADGVDREEAKQLAWRYFAEFHGGCGDVSFGKETADSWYFSIVVGFAATPGEPIVVSKDGSSVKP